LESSTESPLPNQRYLNLTKWFEKASFYNNTSILIFPCRESNAEFVCERGLYYILGYQNADGYISQWRRCQSDRRYQLDPIKYTKPEKENYTMDKISFPVAKETVKAYIKSVASKIAETVPDKSVKEDDVLIVPFLNASDFYYLKYVPDMIELGDPPVSITWFKEAFSEVTNVRTLRCRGSFNTCGICNKAEDLAKDRRFSRPQQRIFEEYKQQHLLQQFKERQTLEENIQLAKGYDQYGNTQHAFLYSDGMTVMTGNTPRKKNNENPYITNRVIGVMAVCGHINEIFIYNLDDFVSGGANTMIEIMRQGKLEWI